MAVKGIDPHEPDEEPIGPEELKQDLESWRRIMVRKRLENMARELANDPKLCELVEWLVRAGVCKDEKEVIARALETFFAAVAPAAVREHLLSR